MEDKFIFTGKQKMVTFALMGIGVIALIIAIMGLLGHHDEHHHHMAANRLWSNILINGIFFFGISLAATFFLAVQYAAEAGWSMLLKRIMEAVSAFLPWGAGVLILVFLGGTMHWHHIYHWMAEGVTQVGHENYDAIIAGKSAFLNQGVFWGLSLVFLAGYVIARKKFRERSLLEDQEGGLTLHKKNITAAAIFLVFFGYSSMVASWLWIMSIDTHWFSTLFGWYVFSGMWIGALIVMTLLTKWLQSKGHLKMLNKSHLHDLGKWMFAISFLWSYLWFSQFSLIWYANIPEEVTYYIARFGDYKVLFLGMFIVNFALPMLLLMDSAMKSNTFMVAFVGILIFIGHWVDTYLLITPGTMKDHAHFGFVEIGMFLGFLGLFLFVILREASKANLVIKNNPYLEESLHFHH